GTARGGGAPVPRARGGGGGPRRGAYEPGRAQRPAEPRRGAALFRRDDRGRNGRGDEPLRGHGQAGMGGGTGLALPAARRRRSLQSAPRAEVTPERWAEVTRVFQAALELEATRRGAD